jgi:isopentenyldiphosphate isomerase
MTETINTYPIQDPETLVPMERDAFYREQAAVFKKTGKPTQIVDIIDILLFNGKAEVLLQKRSYDKNHNPGLIDKSLGGHVQYGDTIDYTVMVETVQELQTPSIVLRSKMDFERTLVLLEKYLGTLAVLRHISSEVHILEKVIDKEPIGIANKVHMFFGMYDGRIRPADGEVQGVLWYTLDDLHREMTDSPKLFTNDLHIFFDRYSNEIDGFLRYVKNKGIS